MGGQNGDQEREGRIWPEGEDYVDSEWLSAEEPGGCADDGVDGGVDASGESWRWRRGADREGRRRPEDLRLAGGVGTSDS